MELILILVVLFVLYIIKRAWFPKNPLAFRLLIKRKGRVEFYRIQVKRPFFGWTGFWCSRIDGKINASNSWYSDRRSELDYAKTYMDLCGLDPDEYVVEEVTL